MDEVRRQFAKISSTEFICKCSVKAKNSNDEDIEKPCGEIIIIGKDSYWNLKRHLNRKHEHVLRQIEAGAGVLENDKKDSSFAWKHFSQLDKSEVMCRLCLETIKTSADDSVIAEMLKHLNEAHEGEIKPDVVQLNTENVDGTPVKKSFQRRRVKKAATTGKKKNRQKTTMSPEDFQSPLTKQFIREQFVWEKSRATCLWCSAKINHRCLTEDADSSPLRHHMLFNHRAVCEKALVNMRGKKMAARTISFSPVITRKRSGATEKYTKKSSSMFAFDRSEDEELYDVHCSSQVETNKTTEQISDLRKGWLKYCSEREKVHDLEVAKLRMRLREKELALHELEIEVESMTVELEEKLECRRQELVQQEVLDARILTKKAMLVREKFYKFSSIADNKEKIKGINKDYSYYGDDYCEGSEEDDGLKTNSRIAKRSYREANSDKDWEPRAKKSRPSKVTTAGRNSCTPSTSSKKRLTNGNGSETTMSTAVQEESNSTELENQVAIINVISLESVQSSSLSPNNDDNKVHNHTTDATDVKAKEVTVETKSELNLTTPDKEVDVIVPVVFEATADAPETIE